MNCLIVDDKKISRTVLSKLLDLDPCLKLAGECDNANDAYQYVLNHGIDLIFLDIGMPGMNGMELAKALENKQTLIIFTTAQPEYAAEAFDLNVVDFLVKPILPVRFLKAVEKAKGILKTKDISSSTGYIFIRTSNEFRQLKINNINYFEASGDYVTINLNEENHTIHSSLKTIEKKLPPDVFLRVHRSFIVNMSKIDKIDGKILVINNSFIPISDAYKAELNKRIILW